jgi:integrase
MATLDKRIGQIRDRTIGYAPLCYCVGSTTQRFLRACLKAHDAILGALPPQARENITSKEVRAAVLAYVALDDGGKQELLKKIFLNAYGAPQKKEDAASLDKLAELWIEQKLVGGQTEKMRKTFEAHEKIFLNFFSAHNLKTTADLNPDTAYKFMKWRGETNYNVARKIMRPCSARTIKQNLQELKQMAKIAYRRGWLASSGIWDDVKVKCIAGVNLKIVEPLPIEAQKEILATLRDMQPWQHDMALLLLVTGMRVGEIDILTKDSLRNNMIALHGDGVGIYKSASGKTAAAARTLPCCRTVAEIFARGYIFQSGAESFKRMFKKTSPFGKKHPGVHPHRLRHTFAVNKLLSQAATLQMVSYQLGHRDVNITANLYGKFVPEHFKVGFEAAIKERRELVEWLENGYFS